MNSLQKGISLTLLSALFNGSTYLFSSLILKKTSVLNMLFFWFFWAILIYLIFFSFKGEVKNLITVLKNKDVALIGFVNSVSALLWSLGILYGGASLTAFIFRLEIVFTILIGVIFLKEKLLPLDFWGISLATVGAFLMAYNSPNIVFSATIIILAAALSSSVTIALVKRLTKQINPISLAAARSFYLFLSFLILGFLLRKIQIPSQTTLAFTFFAAFFGAFLGFITFYKSLSYYEVSKAIVVRSIEPFFAAFFAFIFLREAITMNRIIGAVMITAGVLILAKRKRNSQEK